MKRRVVWSPTARGDLLAIARHIAADNPRAARLVSARSASGWARRRGTAWTRERHLREVDLRPTLSHRYALVPTDAAETIAILHVITPRGIGLRRGGPAERR